MRGGLVDTLEQPLWPNVFEDKAGRGVVGLVLGCRDSHQQQHQ